MSAIFNFSIQQIKDIAEEKNASNDYPNGLKVSKVDNPMYFPVENEYQVGSSEIVGLCSNAMAVGTGQTGAAPLYVFCKDGIYALFVDQTGEVAYGAARIIARDVCNNAKSITPIDAGVVFSTDRGLMCIAGEQVQEIGSPAEGDPLRFDVQTSVDSIKVAENAYKSAMLSNLGSTISGDDFLTYLKGAIINYNHNDRELMVSNPEKLASGQYKYKYTYIMDRNGQWSRRIFSADEYVNNFPSSYRLIGNDLYQVDKDSSADRQGMFILTREIKLDSIGFKNLNRVVARGYFSTPSAGPEVDASNNPIPHYLGIYVFGSYDGRKFACLGHMEKTGNFTDIGCLVERTDCKFYRIVLAGTLKPVSRLDYFEASAKQSVLSTKIR